RAGITGDARLAHQYHDYVFRTVTADEAYICAMIIIFVIGACLRIEDLRRTRLTADLIPSPGFIGAQSEIYSLQQIPHLSRCLRADHIIRPYYRLNGLLPSVRLNDICQPWLIVDSSVHDSTECRRHLQR